MAPTFDITPERQAGQLHFFKSQVVEAKAPALTRKDADLRGQTAIVTGGNVGVGLETARQLLDVGLSKLILAVRNEESGQTAAKELLVGRGDDQKVEVWKLDLSEYASVTAFAERVAKLDARPDVVVLNAGVLCAKPTLNRSTGHDEDVQTNFLSTVLLLILLLPIVKTKPSAAKTTASPVPRISVVSSIMAHWAKFAERDAGPLLPAFDTDDPTNWGMEERYSTSKLLTLLFLSELIRRIPPNLAVINAPTPGVCYGSLFTRQTAGTVVGFMIGIFYRLVGHSCSVGASQVLAAAIRAGPESHGQFLENGKLRPLPVIMYTPEGEKVARKLWMEALQELAFADVENIIKDLSTS
ncbi:NAD(P)-binding protein [Thozetella sp. PMI_491]|nr:NAD(P)-binding protein [Thozetella sp. PMI_491]